MIRESHGAMVIIIAVIVIVSIIVITVIIDKRERYVEEAYQFQLQLNCHTTAKMSILICPMSSRFSKQVLIKGKM